MHTESARNTPLNQNVKVSDNQKRRLLIVDDDDCIRTMLVNIFAETGYAVTPAINGTNAIELLLQSTAPELSFGVVLTDVMLGDVSGLEVTRKARSLSVHPEVILMTGNASLETALAAMRIGAFDYLLKPVGLPELLERVKAAFVRRAERMRQMHEAAAWRRVSSAMTQLPVVQPTPLPPVTEQATPEQPEEPDRFFQVGSLRIDSRRQEVWFQSRQVHVTPIEHIILLCLAETPGQFISYSDIARRTHRIELDDRESYSLLRTHVRNLRRKFDERYLVSMRSVGYMLDEPDGTAVTDNSEDDDF
ncbi:MAG: response regulator transcription factor [Chloroflexaceae bacterium]|nr:response regulator transcription factor [Chloroflexaceae bacterium]